MKKDINFLKSQLSTTSEGIMKGGFTSIRGGLSLQANLPTNDGTCTGTNKFNCSNDGECSGTNNLGCSNDGECSKGDNLRSCANVGSCYS